MQRRNNNNKKVKKKGNKEYIKKIEACFKTHDLSGKKRKKKRNFKGICSMMDENLRVIEKNRNTERCQNKVTQRKNERGVRKNELGNRKVLEC